MERARRCTDVLDRRKTDCAPKHRRGSRLPGYARHNGRATPAARAETGCLAQHDVTVCRGLSLPPAICSSSPAENQQTSFSAGVLDRRAHQSVSTSFSRRSRPRRLARPSTRSRAPAARPARRSCRASRAPVLLPSGADTARPAAAPCRRLPIAGSSAGHVADRDARCRRSHAPHKTARPTRTPVLRSGRSPARAPTGWPAHTDVRPPVPGRPGGQSPRRPARPGLRSSLDNSPPRAASRL